jgi:SprT-like family
MVSVGDRGHTLRLNHTFRTAPIEVLHALGTLLARGSRGAPKAAAKILITDFLRRTQHIAPVERKRVRHRDDEPLLQRLQTEFDRVNAEFFDGSLPVVPIAVSGRLRRRNGSFSSHPLEIVISRALCRDAHLGEAEKTLRHEMIHLWQHYSGHPLGHGPDFRRWAVTLEVHPRATRDVAWIRQL